ncbi:MAG TPA: hypothetical protein VJ249_11140 [Candidatus Bathyarchaeia archaeon]|nr:hypothetical protein [Candidatus Bathyarchaeia archaeon]
MVLGQNFDLVVTKDPSLIGATGEMIAWKYLRGKRIWTHRIGSWYPFPPSHPLRKGEDNFELRGLKDEQVEYLKNNYLRGPRPYDFVGVKRKRGPDGFVGEADKSWRGSNRRAIP